MSDDIEFDGWQDTEEETSQEDERIYKLEIVQGQRAETLRVQIAAVGTKSYCKSIANKIVNAIHSNSIDGQLIEIDFIKEIEDNVYGGTTRISETEFLRAEDIRKLQIRVVDSADLSDYTPGFLGSSPGIDDL